MTTTNNELILTRLIHAPRTAVWKAWTVAKYTAQWWGPHGFTTPVCELDMRPDGPIRIDMRAPDGIVYPMTGTYLEIAEPKLLIFTSSALDANGTPLFKVLTAVTLVAQEHHTKLILHATVSESTPEAAPYLEGMETGWTQSLERLDYVVVQEMHDASLAPSLAARWSTCGSYLQSVLRIVAACMFIVAGTTKLFAFPAGIPPNGGTVPLISQLGIGAILEIFGGGLLLLGLFTRPVAFLLAGEMAVAYFQFHFPASVWPVMNGGVPAVLYCFLWLYFSAAGAGPWSLDARR